MITEEDILLELKGIYFNYPNSLQPVFENMSFTFNKKERIGLIGPNGCGKTTFLKICIGLIKPDKGQIFFKGKPVRSEEDLFLMRKGIGFVFQNPDDQLFSPTVLEDVAFGPLNLGMSVDQAKAIARESLDLVGMNGFEDRITHKLSGGEKRLLSLATVLSMQPEAMLLDEPTTGLDPYTRNHIIKVLNQLDIGLIIVSHDWDFIAQTTSKFYSIEHGCICKIDKDAFHQHLHYHPGGHFHHEHGTADSEMFFVTD